MDFRICTPVNFIPLICWKNTGRTGSRYIYVNRYMATPRPVYERLLSFVKDKDYFVLTTNVDHCFQKAGFDKKRLFYTQGDYGLLQCSVLCHQKTYDNQKQIEEMLKSQGFLSEKRRRGRDSSCRRGGRRK